MAKPDARLNARVATWSFAAVLALSIAIPVPSPAQEPAASGLAASSPAPLTPDERNLIFETLRASDEASPVAAGASDAALLAALKSYAGLRLGLRVEPSRIDRLWALAPAHRNIDAEVEQARRSGVLGAWLNQLAPPSPAYAGLLAERARYVGIVKAGGWTPLAAPAVLREGDVGPAVVALRRRLRAEGYEVAAVDEQNFDPGLAVALRDFQTRHLITPDAVLGPQTQRALNVSAQARLDQVEANLERLRWLPGDLPRDRVEVDVGAAEATLFEAGQPRLQMRAIVGDPRHQTPMFASRLESMVFNPPWNVPNSIAQAEILPKAARDPGYLARNNFTVTAHGLQQRPGPKNSLGQIKFDLPSPFGVYLHDTPGKSSFARQVRTLSHGCMRLEKPHELAAALLEAQGWSPQSIAQVIAAGATRRVVLATPMPLFVLYRTVGLDGAGRAIFHPDPYGWDSKLTAALSHAGAR